MLAAVALAGCGKENAVQPKQYLASVEKLYHYYTYYKGELLEDYSYDVEFVIYYYYNDEAQLLKAKTVYSNPSKPDLEEAYEYDSRSRIVKAGEDYIFSYPDDNTVQLLTYPGTTSSVYYIYHLGANGLVESYESYEADLDGNKTDVCSEASTYEWKDGNLMKQHQVLYEDGELSEERDFVHEYTSYANPFKGVGIQVTPAFDRGKNAVSTRTIVDKEEILRYTYTGAGAYPDSRSGVYTISSGTLTMIASTTETFRYSETIPKL